MKSKNNKIESEFIWNEEVIEIKTNKFTISGTETIN